MSLGLSEDDTIVLQSMPALAACLTAVLLVFAHRRRGAGRIVAFFSLLCTAVLMLFALVRGVSMHEALAYSEYRYPHSFPYYF